MMDHRTMMGFRRDETLAQHRIDRAVMRRVFRYIRPYTRQLIAFVATVIAGSVATAVSPLLLKSLLDTAIPHHDRTLVMWIALGAVFLALANGVLSLVQRYYSARIGEGLIFDLRSKLFDHVQRMPIAFFTRTQTGALISRLNNDVVGAQSAMTGTLGNVVTSLITVGTTVAVMLYLDWELTLLALALLPAFVIPSKRVGKRLQRITREQMGLNADMNSTMQERFNVSGAMVSKLFGHPDQELESFSQRAGRVRDIGVKIAVYARTLFVTLALVSAVGTAVVIYVGGRLALSGRLTPGDVA